MSAAVTPVTQATFREEVVESDVPVPAGEILRRVEKIL